VLDGFVKRNPGVTVTYRAASGDVPAALARQAGTAAGADIGVLSLPADLDEFRTLAKSGTLKPIEFAVPEVRARYAFSWKQLGTVDAKLYGLFFKATNRSAFWFNQSHFRSQSLAAPTSWRALRRLAETWHGPKPFAIGARDNLLLPNLFQNIYLAQQGNRRYDMLARGDVRWTDASVRTALATLREAFVHPTKVAGGLDSLSTDYRGAVQKVFGSPQRASMVPGGSAAIPVLQTAKAVRPITQFGAFPFPTMDGKGPARVIGDANAAVLLEDGPAARALIAYLATAEAATIWAKRGVDFLSPNRSVDLASYSPAPVRTLAAALQRASVFRFGIADMESAPFKDTMNRLLVEYVRSPQRLSHVTAQLAAAAAR
jgi:alpha-glucoside transport system substrate-binding protein